MNRNELLAATQDLFRREFAAAMRACVENCSAVFYARAEKAKSSLEERNLYTARDDLTKRADSLNTALTKSLEKLLHRSFQTAHNPDETSPRMQAIRADDLSLVETKTVDWEMRVDAMLKRIRDEAGDELRDLNIRMALLFLQETVDERENPFRPYVMVVATENAVKALEFSQDTEALISAELTEQLRSRAQDIYAALNALLAKNGVGTELKLRVHKQSDGNRARADEPVPDEPTPADSARSAASQKPHAAQAQAERHAPIASAAPPMDQSQARVEKFIQWIRNPENPPGTGAEPMMGGLPQQQSGQFMTSTNADGSVAEQGALSQQPTTAEASPAPRSNWVSGVKAVGGAIRRLFSVGRSLVSGDAAAPADAIARDDDSRPLMTPTMVPISARLSQSVENLMGQHVPDAASMVGQDQSIRNLIMENREQLTALTDDSAEQMTIDVVAMLFEFILRDAEVPSETRAQMGRLQYLVLKIALRDNEFFTHKSHPARMLVNRIGSLAISLRQADPSGVKLNDKVRDIVERLLAAPSEDVSLFAAMVDELDQFVAGQLRSAQESVELAAQTIEQVESRTLKFARITSVIADALSAMTVDENLRRLLIVDWASVVEHAERVSPASAARFRELVPAMVWSVFPKVTDADRKQLVKLLPDILKTVRDGLALLGWSRAQQDHEFTWLVDNHTRALRATHIEGSVPSLALVRELFKPFLQMREAEEATKALPSDRLDETVVANIRRDLGTNVQVVDHLLASDPSIPAAPPPSETPSLLSREDQAVIARLRAGVAMELKLVGSPRTGRLTWVSASTKSMVFTYDEKQDTFILSARMFLRLLGSGHARFIDPEPLLERALTSLLASADKLDAVTKPA